MALAFLLFGWLAHRAYTRARAALRLEPNLRGAWVVKHAWWLFPVAFVAIPSLVLVGFVFASIVSWFPGYWG